MVGLVIFMEKSIRAGAYRGNSVSSAPWPFPFNCRAKPTGPRNLAGARRVSAERPKVRISQSISRVLDGMRKPIRIRDGHSSWTPVARRLQQPTRAAVLDIDLKC